MRGFGDHTASQHGLKLTTRQKPLHEKSNSGMEADKSNPSIIDRFILQGQLAKGSMAKAADKTNCQTARRLRPLARRAAITARPPRVFMRVKKPWVRARLTLEGW
jgi:hypothetical protein